MRVDDFRGRAYKVSRHPSLHNNLADSLAVTRTHGVGLYADAFDSSLTIGSFLGARIRDPWKRAIAA